MRYYRIKTYSVAQPHINTTYYTAQVNYSEAINCAATLENELSNRLWDFEDTEVASDIEQISQHEYDVETGYVSSIDSYCGD